MIYKIFYKFKNMASDKNILILESVLKQLDNLDYTSEKVMLRLESIKEKISRLIENDLNNPLDLSEKEKLDLEKEKFSRWIEKEWVICDNLKNKMNNLGMFFYRSDYNNSNFSSNLFEEFNSSSFCFCKKRNCSRFKKNLPEEKENLAKFIR